MEINDKKLKRTRKIINFLISFVLAVFLILLSDTIIRDLDRTIEYPERTDFNTLPEGIKLNDQLKPLSARIESLGKSNENIQKMIYTAESNKEAEQQSFDNWITTRSTLGSPKQDPEVLKRLAKLDEYQRIVQEWTAQSDSISTQIQSIYAEQATIEQQISEHNNGIEKVYEKSMINYDLRVFLIRLLFTAPILALGIYLFIRKRNHKLSPIFMGISLFSVYVFFFGLVPYLPSYGGYIRYSMGVLLTVGLGYYAIKRLKNYSDRKNAELKASSEERATMMQTDTAEKAFNNNICPSCGKNFLLKSWEGLANVNINSAKPTACNFCRFCGMQLIKNCSACQQPNYAHLPHCVSCGEKLK